MPTDNQRDFKGVWIPKQVWLDTRLTALDKVILTEIDSLDQGERGCFASNKHIAEFCQCSETKVSKSIATLIKYGYLYVQKFDGRQRELKSRLTNNANQPCKKDKSEKQKVQESNTSTNPAINTDIEYIINYLNEKTGSHYRPDTKGTIKLLKGLLTGKHPYTVDDCIKVIDNQTAKWKGTEWEQYLRPSTLFGGKFENYLNAKPNERNNTNGQTSSDSGKVRVGHYL